MMIVKCSKCEKLIHKSKKCFHCGNTVGFERIEASHKVHENVLHEYKSVEDMVSGRKYTEAIELSQLVLEWMPSCSDVFWLRNLAKNHCSDDTELIQKGFTYNESADFYNAIRFADHNERQIYSDIQDKIDAVKNALISAIAHHEYIEKANTPIARYQQEMPREIDTRRQSIFELWSKFKQVEQDLCNLEMDCRLIVNEHSESLQKASSTASSLKTKMYSLKECTADELHHYQVELGAVLRQSEESKKALENMKKQHPWIKSFNELLAQRSRIISMISTELSNLKLYENRIEATLSEIERIESIHKEAILSVEKMEFQSIRSLLGEDCFVAAFLKAGVN